MACLSVVSHLLEDDDVLQCVMCAKPVNHPSKQGIVHECKKCGLLAHASCLIVKGSEPHRPCNTNRHFAPSFVTLEDNVPNPSFVLLVKAVMATPSSQPTVPPAVTRFTAGQHSVLKASPQTSCSRADDTRPSLSVVFHLMEDLKDSCALCRKVLFHPSTPGIIHKCQGCAKLAHACCTRSRRVGSSKTSCCRSPHFKPQMVALFQEGGLNTRTVQIVTAALLPANKHQLAKRPAENFLAKMNPKKFLGCSDVNQGTEEGEMKQSPDVSSAIVVCNPSSKGATTQEKTVPNDSDAKSGEKTLSRAMVVYRPPSTSGPTLKEKALQPASQVRNSHVHSERCHTPPHSSRVIFPRSDVNLEDLAVGNYIWACACVPHCNKNECKNPVYTWARPSSHSIHQSWLLPVPDGLVPRLKGKPTAIPAPPCLTCGCPIPCADRGMTHCLCPKVAGSASFSEKPLSGQDKFLWHISASQSSRAHRLSCFCRPFCLSTGKAVCDDPEEVPFGRVMFNMSMIAQYEKSMSGNRCSVPSTTKRMCETLVLCQSSGRRCLLAGSNATGRSGGGCSMLDGYC